MVGGAVYGSLGGVSWLTWLSVVCFVTQADEPKTQQEKLLAEAVKSGAVVPWLQKMVRRNYRTLAY